MLKIVLVLVMATAIIARVSAVYKEGSCPPRSTIPQYDPKCERRNDCRIDQDCEGTWKCCDYICGSYTCREPIFYGSRPQESRREGTPKPQSSAAPPIGLGIGWALFTSAVVIY